QDAGGLALGGRGSAGASTCRGSRSGGVLQLSRRGRDLGRCSIMLRPSVRADTSSRSWWLHGNRAPDGEPYNQNRRFPSDLRSPDSRAPGSSKPTEPPHGGHGSAAGGAAYLTAKGSRRRVACASTVLTLGARQASAATTLRGFPP